MTKKRFQLPYKWIERLLIIFGLLLVVSYASVYLIHNWDKLLNLSETSKSITDFFQRLRSPTWTNFAILTLLTAVTAAIPFMSNAAFAIFNGMTFGPFIGFAMTLTANLLGNFGLIQILKVLPLSRQDSKVNEHLKTLDKLPDPKLAIAIGYMFPIVPTILVNYRIVEMKLNFREWLLLASIGLAPLSLLYTLGGTAILRGNIKLLVAIIVIGGLALIGFKIFQKKGHHKHESHRHTKSH